jgi:hypothetical protein
MKVNTGIPPRHLVVLSFLYIIKLESLKDPTAKAFSFIEFEVPYVIYRFTVPTRIPVATISFTNDWIKSVLPLFLRPTMLRCTGFVML